MVVEEFGWFEDNSGGICERKILFWMKKKRIKPGLRARERGRKDIIQTRLG